MSNLKVFCYRFTVILLQMIHLLRRIYDPLAGLLVMMHMWTKYEVLSFIILNTIWRDPTTLKKKKNLFFAQKPNIKINKHVNKVRKATGRAEAITAGRQQNKQQYIIIKLMKKKERIKTCYVTQAATHRWWTEILYPHASTLCYKFICEQNLERVASAIPKF